MVKKLVLTLLLLIFPIMIFFTFYRALMGLGPVSLSVVVERLSTSFDGTVFTWHELIELWSDARDDLTAVMDKYYTVYPKIGVPSLAEVAFDGLSSIVLICRYGLQLGFVFVRLIVQFINDFISIGQIVVAFLVESTPYPVNPYFPTS